VVSVSNHPTRTWRWHRAAPVAFIAVFLVFDWACSAGSRLFRQYEYEEEMRLSLDGTATLLVSGSVPALNALRGLQLDARPNARLDRQAIRSHYTTAVTRVTRVSSSRRNNRVFAHVRIEVDDVRRLGEAPPFGWSAYQVSRRGDLVSFRQTVGAVGGASSFQWDGDELVAFRLHLPSEIVSDNSPGPVQRGNILEWEQPLAKRLRGEPVAIEADIKPQSILYRTLLLFGGAALAVAAMFGIIIWWMVRRAGSDA
jgi:hypothetical protein